LVIPARLQAKRARNAYRQSVVRFPGCLAVLGLRGGAVDI
jgi:hypothetical protein